MIMFLVRSKYRIQFLQMQKEFLEFMEETHDFGLVGHVSTLLQT